MKRALQVVAEAAKQVCCAGPSVPRLGAAAGERHARVFRALGDQTRLEIVAMIARAGRALCACDVEREFELSQPTISHHLKVLREAGLVTSERRGTWIYYALDRGTVGELAQLCLLVHGG